MTTTSYDDLIPKGVLFNLKEIEDMRLIKVDMAKKLISNGELEFVKIGNKIHISRAVLVKYLEENTVYAQY
ncbi:MAG: DNA-binding protein [Campylobacterota bacterium]